MYLVFNIETITDPSSPSVASLSEEAMEAPAGWKDPEKIADRKRENYLKALDGTGLQPLTGQIVCIDAVIPTTEADIFFSTIAPQPELEMLSGFRSFLEGLDNAVLVTYNGELFDVPYVISRMMALNVPIPEILRKAAQKKWDSHIDMFKVLGKKGKLKEWALRYGLEPIFGDGSLVQGWYDAGDFGSIKRHCEDNVRVTAELLRRYVAS